MGQFCFGRGEDRFRFFTILQDPRFPFGGAWGDNKVKKMKKLNKLLERKIEYATDDKFCEEKQIELSKTPAPNPSFLHPKLQEELIEACWGQYINNNSKK